MHLLERAVKTFKKHDFTNFIKLLADFFKHKYKMRYGYFIHRTAVLNGRKFIKIGKFAEIQNYVIINASADRIIIGDYSQINPFTVIYGHNRIEIGNNVMIAPHCMIASGNHNYLQLEKPMRHGGNFTKGPLIIEDNVWIGANTTITDGVTIGHNAVVSANSVVTKDVAPFDVVGGVPAKIISNRLETILNKKLTDDEKTTLGELYKKRYKELDFTWLQ